MTTEDIIIHIFYLVGEDLEAVKHVPQTHVYPSEIVAIGILFALKGGHFRVFYRWLSRDFAPLFAGLQDRTDLQRLLKTHQQHCDKRVAAASVLTVIDSYPIEWIFPIRQDRSQQQVGKKTRTRDDGRLGSGYVGWSTPLVRSWAANG